MSRTPHLILALCVMLALPLPGAPGYARVLRPDVLHALKALPPGETLNVIVHLDDEVDRSGDGNAIGPRRDRIARAQAGLRAWLETRRANGLVSEVTPFWIFNGFAVTASREAIFELAQQPGIDYIGLDATVSLPAYSPLPAAESVANSNLSLIHAPEVWSRGLTGKGIVVAVLDSGADLTHPDLAARWRGGDNSWFDATGEFPDAPADLAGHGTQTLGVILGGDAGGTPIGVAPGAQWIAARIFDSRGRASLSHIHAALQWVIDPDGDPSTPDQPHIVNNSWSFANPRCNPEFADDLRALRAAGILPIFAAGIHGSVSPANTPEAFAVGAVARDGETQFYDSPGGPSVCEGVDVFPHLVAPGDNIRTSDLFGGYVQASGTSLAAAHVSGALALLLQADPDLSVEEQARLLTDTADDLGAPGIDLSFGYGRLNIAAAIDRVLGPTPARATPTPDQAGSAALIATGVGVLIVVIGMIGLRRRSIRLGLWLAMTASLGLTSLASAHAVLLKSSPVAGQRLSTPPAQIILWFNEELVTTRSTLGVFDVDGRQVDARDGYVDLSDPDHASLIVSLPPLADGTYTVRWQAMSFDDDGLTAGEFEFLVGNALPSKKNTSAAGPPLDWLPAAIAAALALAGVLTRRARRRVG